MFDKSKKLRVFDEVMNEEMQMYQKRNFGQM